jgi:hypothetical protein
MCAATNGADNAAHGNLLLLGAWLASCMHHMLAGAAKYLIIRA